MDITYKNLILPQDHIDDLIKKYTKSYKVTLKEIDNRESDKRKAKKKKLEALRLTRHYCQMDLQTRDEFLRMSFEDINVLSIPVKKKRRRKKKKNYCSCSGEPMCFCWKPNGDWVRPI